MKPKPTKLDLLLAAVDKATNYSMENATIMRVLRPALKHLKVRL